MQRSELATEERETPRKQPPKLMVRAMNLLANGILRSPIHGLMSDTVLLLSFRGRKSGRMYTTPMSYAMVGDEILMSTKAPWWRNLTGGAAVTIRLRDKDVEGYAEAIPDEQGSVEGIKTLLHHYPKYSRFLGVTMDEAGHPDEVDVRSAVRRGRVFIRVSQMSLSEG